MTHHDLPMPLGRAEALALITDPTRADGAGVAARRRAWAVLAAARPMTRPQPRIHLGQPGGAA